MIKEFKEFALKGNMLDLAIGIVIGGAFGTVIKSLVEDVIMPLVSGLLKLPDFSNIFIVLKNPTDTQFTSVLAAREAGASVLGLGLFINAIIGFAIVALALFLIVKGINKMKKKEEAAAPAGPTELDILKEIRDSLKK